MSLEMMSPPLNHLRGSNPFVDLDCLPLPAGAPARVISLKNVDIHYYLMEMPVAEAIAALPPSLHPSTPGHLTATFYSVPDSEIGPFELVVMGVGCRAGIRPRMLTTRAFASTAASAKLMRECWAYPCEVADVHTTRGYHGFDSRLTVNQVVALELSTRVLEPVIGMGAAVKYCSPLNLVSFNSKRQLVQVDIGYEFDHTRTERGALQIIRFRGDLLGLSPNVPEFTICGTRARVDIEFHPPKILMDLEQLPDYGGVTKLPGN